MPSHLHTGVHQFCSNRTRGGHFDVPNEVRLQCRRPTACLHYGATKEGAKHAILERQPLPTSQEPPPATNEVGNIQTKICSSINLSGCLENGISKLGTMVSSHSRGATFICLTISISLLSL